MKVKTFITDANGLETKLNDIGWCHVLQILPDYRYDGTVFVIIYKEFKEICDDPLYNSWQSFATFVNESVKGNRT